MSVDTFGSLHLDRGVIRARYVAKCEPHAMMMLKRHLPRASSHQWGLVVQASDEVAHLIRWFTVGYPLEMDDATRRDLDLRADRYLATRKTFRAVSAGERIVGEPVRLKVELREYQQVGVHLARVSRGLLLADEMGLGKTLQAIGLIAGEPQARPALVVCELHLMRQWREQFKRAAPELRVHIIRKGTPYNVDVVTNLMGEQSSPRGALSQAFDPGRVPDVLIMPYSRLAKWGPTLSTVIRGVVYDEVQSLRAGESTEKGGAAAMVSDAAEYRLGLSGTPIYNYGAEMHSVMRFVAPGALGGRGEFLTEWCSSANDDRKASVRDPVMLGVHMRNSGIMLRRTRADVGRELPALSKIPVEVPSDRKALDEMQGRAAELARLILDRRPEIKGFDRLRASEELSSLVRQATGIAKAPYVAGFIHELVMEGTRPVVFGWHHEVYALWRAELTKALVMGADGEMRPIRVAWFTGQESVSQKAASLDAFKSGEADVLVMSLRAGAGVDGLQHVTNTVVFGELDWSPKVHDQCVTRVYRDGQTEPVMAYFPWTDAGSDPIVLDVIGAKRAQSDPMLTTGDDDDSDDVLLDANADNRAQRLAEHVLHHARSPDEG